MSSGRNKERLFDIWAAVSKMVVDGKRGPGRVADHLQKIIDSSAEFASDNFELFLDLGTIIVPNNFNPETWLGSFSLMYRKHFRTFSNEVFQLILPRWRPKPGSKLRVRVFNQVVSGPTSYEERETFLKAQGAVFPGVIGLTMLWEAKKAKLPKGWRYESYNGLGDLGGVSTINFEEREGSFDLCLNRFQERRYFHDTLVCFTEASD